LETSLRLLRTDHLDLYHLHGIGWELFLKHLDPSRGGKGRLLLKAKEQGLAKHIGFSFHDVPENLIKLIDTGYFENVILQYNLLDQRNTEVMNYARAKGLGVVVMGPIGGGRLGLPSATIADLTQGAAQSTPEAALRFVWAHPAVQVALSGMTTMAQLEQNVAIAKQSGPFSTEQIAALNQAITARKMKSGLYCSACRYCIPACAAGVNIPENLDILNEFLIYGLKDNTRNRYAKLHGKAAACIACGKCVPLCPQKIQIPEKLREAALLLDARAGSIYLTTTADSVTPDGTFRMKVGLHNFASQERAIQLAVSGTGNTRATPVQKDFAVVPPMARRSVVVSGQACDPAACAGARPSEQHQISLDIDVTSNGVTQHTEFAYNYLLLAAGESRGWDSHGWITRKAVASDFTAHAETAHLHGVRFALSCVNESLLLLADVQDDFLCPSNAATHTGQVFDGVEVFLDGRDAAAIGRAQYEKGVYQLFISPGTPGTHPAFIHSPQGLQDVTVSSEKTADGYRLRAVIPFAAFCVTKGLPRKIGFALTVNTADKNGNRIGQIFFAGGSNNWCDASVFREVWLA